MKAEDEGNELEFPYTELDSYSGNPYNNHFGITKREYFAAMAIQGILANPELFGLSSGILSDIFSKWAVKQADSLINELNKEK